MVSSFATKAILTELSIKVIGMGGKDKDATVSANSHLRANENSGYYHKCKIAREDIIDIIKVRDAAYAYRREITRPYGSNDQRMLPTALILEYNAELAGFKAQFTDAAMQIQNDWPNIVDMQRQRLEKRGGSLFNIEDYPTQAEVLDEFEFTVGQVPVPDADHFLLDLEAEVIEDLKRQHEESHKKKMEKSNNDLIRRLLLPVTKMADICGKDKKVFDSLVNNLQDQTKILTTLNITNDANLNMMISDVKNRLTRYTPGQIRDDKILKARLGTEAETLATELQHALSN
jgi:hypothetical protein